MNPPTPTLCLVMDGARIVSYEIGSAQDLDLPQYMRDAQENGWTVRTIPLALCAIAPEMREALKLCREDLLGMHLVNEILADEARRKRPHEPESLTKTIALLSRID